MPLTLIRQDITHLHVDAIVNAANTRLMAGGGVCGAIFAAAGRDELQRACDEIGHVDTGAAVATPGFALPARHIIHTAGPVWHGGSQGERALLASCYRSSLELATSLGDTSIAFPLISSGIYGYPPSEALAVAVEAIRGFLVEQPDMEVTLCLFSRDATTLSQETFGAIQQYVDDSYVAQAYGTYGRPRELFGGGIAPEDIDHYIQQANKPQGMPWDDAHASLSAAAPCAAPAPAGAPAPPSADEEGKHAGFPLWPRRKRREREQEETIVEEMAIGSASKPSASLDDMLRSLDAPFPQLLLSMIDERGMTDAEVYARANLSRQYFSKLRSGKVNPSKRVVVSLALALELDLDETNMLLERAGHALTHASKFDVIVEWFIRAGRYDVFEINQALFAYDQALIGAS